MDWKKDIKMNEIVKDWDKKKELILLVLFTYAITGIFGGALDYIWNIPLWKALTQVYRITVLIPAFIYFVKHKYKFKDLFKVKSVWEFVIGIGIALFIIVIMLVLSKTSIDINRLSRFNAKKILRLLYHYIIIIALREEFVFRIAIERCLEDNFAKYKAISPLITAMLFSYWHVINNTWQLGVITFFTGLIFGYSFYLIKKCSFISVVIGHGLYDFLVILFGIRMWF